MAVRRDRSRKVAILGVGVIGATTAYYLAKAGHEVTVIERQPGPALESSYVNAGEVSPGYAAAWAGPGVPVKAIKWLLMQHSPLVIKPIFDAAMWRWGDDAQLAPMPIRVHVVHRRARTSRLELIAA